MAAGALFSRKLKKDVFYRAWGARVRGIYSGYTLYSAYTPILDVEDLKSVGAPSKTPCFIEGFRRQCCKAREIAFSMADRALASGKSTKDIFYRA